MKMFFLLNSTLSNWIYQIGIIFLKHEKAFSFLTKQKMNILETKIVNEQIVCDIVMFHGVVVVSGMHRTQCTQFEIGRRRHLLIHLQWKISNDTRNIFGKSYKHSILISALAFPLLFDFAFLAERVYDCIDVTHILTGKWILIERPFVSEYAHSNWNWNWNWNWKWNKNEKMKSERKIK